MSGGSRPQVYTERTVADYLADYRTRKIDPPDEMSHPQQQYRHQTSVTCSSEEIGGHFSSDLAVGESVSVSTSDENRQQACRGMDPDGGAEIGPHIDRLQQSCHIKQRPKKKILTCANPQSSQCLDPNSEVTEHHQGGRVDHESTHQPRRHGHDVPFSGMIRGPSLIPVPPPTDRGHSSEKDYMDYGGSSLPRSSENSEKGKTIECDYCLYKSKDRADIRKHVNLHHDGEYPFGCPMCDRRFGREKYANDHIKTHSDRDYLIPSPNREDEYEFKAEEEDLDRRRISSSNSNKRRLSDESGGSSKYQSSSKRPKGSGIQASTGGSVGTLGYSAKDKKYGCSTCEYRCRQKKDLDRHIRKHTGAKPFKCFNCDFHCSRKDNLAKHTCYRLALTNRLASSQVK